MSNNFDKDADEGLETENKVAQLYENDDRVKVRRPVYTKKNEEQWPPYDLVVYETKDNGNTEHFTVEVKSWDGTGPKAGAFFETRSTATGKSPQYIRHSHQVDRFVRFNTTTGVAAEIENETVVALLRKHVKSLGGDGRYKESLNKAGTAWGVVLDVMDRAIGFQRPL